VLTRLSFASPAAVSRFRRPHDMRPLCSNDAYNGERESHERALQGHEDAWFTGDDLSEEIKLHDTVRLV